MDAAHLERSPAPGRSTSAVERTSPPRVERLRIVYELTEAVGRATDLHQIYDAALDALQRALPADRAAILLDDDEGVMRFQAWRALSPEYRAAVEGHSPWRRDDPAPEPVLVHDVARDPAWTSYRDILFAEGIHALAFIPLVARQRLIGKFMVYFDAPHEFTEEEVLVARAIGGHVAFAVERRQSEQQLQVFRGARKRTEQALQFLANASASLDRSLDWEATLRELAGLTVPLLADWSIVDVALPDGRTQPAAAVHSDPVRGASLTRGLASRPAGTASSAAAAEAIRSGTMRRIRDAGSWLRRELAAGADEPLLGAKDAMVVPLAARGRVLGALTLVSTEREYTEADVTLAEDLARRAATALDNARLYREAQESDRRKEQFLAVLAHELRNPLAPLLTSLELVRLAGVGNTEQSSRAHLIMERQIRNLTRLVDDLLDVSRITRGKIELQRQPISIAEVVEDAIETARPSLEDRRITVTSDLAPDLCVDGDPLRLEQVLTNLLNNAAKYTPPDGHVAVSATRDGDQVVIRVRDDGIGIPADVLPHVFDPFVQGAPAPDRAPCGLGIGLTLARALVEMHGGSMSAASAGPDAGSEFTIRLPRVATPRSTPPFPLRPASSRP